MMWFKNYMVKDGTDANNETLFRTLYQLTADAQRWFNEGEMPVHLKATLDAYNK